jgi:hypothetical protein
LWRTTEQGLEGDDGSRAIFEATRGLNRIYRGKFVPSTRRISIKILCICVDAAGQASAALIDEIVALLTVNSS